MHDAAARILDEIEDALASPHHDDIVRQALRAQFLIEHGHVSEEDAHAAIWRAVNGSGYVESHGERDVRRVLDWVASAVAEKIMAGDDVDELADEMELEWELDAFEDEVGERSSKLVPVPAVGEPEPPSFDERLTTVRAVGPYRKPDWWIRPLLPKGHLVLLAGEAGIGKGLLSIQLTIDVVRAGGRVLWLSTEDDANTLVARMQAGGCNGECEDVLIGEWFKQNEIEALIREKHIDVIFLDAGRDYVHKPAGGSNNADEVIRPGLLYLRKVAMDTGATIVFIHHTAKSSHRGDGSLKSAVERVLGSGAYLQVPRHALFLGRNSDDELAVGVIKTNMSRRDVMYRVSIRDFDPEGLTLDAITAVDEDRLVYMERASALEDGFGDWLAAKSPTGGPINRDDDVLALMRTMGGALPGPEKLHALKGGELAISKNAMEASYTRLADAGTIVYNERRKKWFVTEDD